MKTVKEILDIWSLCVKVETAHEMKNGVVSWTKNLKWKNLRGMKLKLKCVMQTANEMKTEKVALTKIVCDV